jgi:FMN phosphatase YigB (HAD superfamily)
VKNNRKQIAIPLAGGVLAAAVMLGIYRGILSAFQFFEAPEDCMMVGNDIANGIVPAKRAGMKTFFVTVCHNIRQRAARRD